MQLKNELHHTNFEVNKNKTHLEIFINPFTYFEQPREK